MDHYPIFKRQLKPWHLSYLTLTPETVLATDQKHNLLQGCGSRTQRSTNYLPGVLGIICCRVFAYTTAIRSSSSLSLQFYTVDQNCHGSSCVYTKRRPESGLI